MQISIVIPIWLQPLLQYIGSLWSSTIWAYTAVSATIVTSWNEIRTFIAFNNVWVPLLGILLLFWPLVLSLGMAVLYSWAWIFWIVTSMILGTIQVIYAAYQFLMISLDLIGLSMLKSYSVLRHQAMYYIDIATTTTISRIHGMTGNAPTATTGTTTSTTSIIHRKSRRRIWREKLEQAGSYENFLKIRIEPKDTSDMMKELHIQQTKQRNKDRVDAALPDIGSIGNTPNSSSNIVTSSFSHQQQQKQHQPKQQKHRPGFIMDEISSATSTNNTVDINGINGDNNTYYTNNNNPMRRAHSFSLHPTSFLVENYDIDGQHRVFESMTVSSSPTHAGSSSSSSSNNNNSPTHTATTKGPRRNLSFSSGDKSPFDKGVYIDPIVAHELGLKRADLLVTTIARLKEARISAMNATALAAANANTNTTTTSSLFDHQYPNNNHNHDDNKASLSLHYLLSAVVKRNHLTLDDILIENARSVAETGQCGLTQQSRQLIRAYYAEVQKGLDWIADAPLLPDHQQQQPESKNHNNNYNNNNHNTNSIQDVGGSSLSNPQHSSHSQENNTTATNNSNNNNNGYSNTPSIITADIRRQSDLSDRITLIRKMKQNMGRTALMFSGGGAQAMYHLGMIRALIESRLYDDLSVISGTSGGSIAAAMCAMKTADELYNDVCVPTVSTNYGLDGKMKAQNIRWFPSMLEMISYWMKHRLVVDSAEFGRTCEFYYSDTTFEEAFVRTGKHVCITVSASRASGNTAQRLLLNHISTPNVTIASA
jgi:Patatin-like phospholipase